MSEASDSEASEAAATTPATSATGQAVVVAAKPNRLYQVAAWIAIVAGTLFIVGAVFCTGLLLGRHGEGSGCFGHHRHGGPGMMMQPGGPMGPMGPMQHPGGPMGPMQHPGDVDQGGSPDHPRSAPPGAPGPSVQPTAPNR